MRRRQILMTISTIETNLIEVTNYGTPQRWVPTYIRVTAYGEGETHEWELAPGQRCWIGDEVSVTVIEPDAPPAESTPLTPPPIDKR